MHSCGTRYLSCSLVPVTATAHCRPCRGSRGWDRAGYRPPDGRLASVATAGRWPLAACRWPMVGGRLPADTGASPQRATPSSWQLAETPRSPSSTQVAVLTVRRCAGGAGTRPAVHHGHGPLRHASALAACCGPRAACCVLRTAALAGSQLTPRPRDLRPRAHASSERASDEQRSLA